MRFRKLALLLPFVAVIGCSDDATGPLEKTSVRPNYDHTFDPAVGRIAVNNYVLNLNGAAMDGTYKNQSAIFNGNMAYGVSSTQVFHVNTANGATDFSGIGLPVAVESSGAVAGTANYTSTLFIEKPSVALGPKTPLGIYTVRETYAWSGAPDDDYLILKYTMTNTTDAPISGLYTGMLLDPDVAVPNTNVSSYDASRNAAIIQNGGAFPSPTSLAVVLLNRNVGGYYAWTNGGALHDPTTNQAWFDIISSPIVPTPLGPADVRQYVGADPVTLQPGETQVVAFAVVGGDNLGDLNTNIAAAKAKSAGVLEPSKILPIRVTIASTLSLYTARMTFATAADAAKFSPSDARCGSAPILSSLVTGRVVDVTFGALDVDDELRTGDRMYCTGRLTDRTYFAGFDTPQINADLTPITALTHFAGSDYTPQFSPDGTQLVFGSARNGGGLFVMNVADGDVSATQLTTNPLDMQPSWSPDGHTIVFARQDLRVPSNCTTSCTTLVPGGIFAVDVATKTVSRLTQNVFLPSSNPDDRVDSDPRYSPDGTRIAYRRFRGGSPATTPAAGNHIWIMGSNGDMSPNAASVPLVTAGSQDIFPEWSADGSRLYFSTAGVARGETSFLKIWSIDPNIGEASATRLSDNEAISWTFGAMSPDGRTMLSVSKAEIVLQDIQTDLHTVPLFDPRITVLSQATTVQNLSWSPTGDRFVFVADNEIFITSPKHIVTPVERAEALETAIAALIEDGLIGASDGAVLQTKLGNVTMLVTNGSLNAAVNNVNAFINKVNALVSSRRMNTVTAEVMTTNANALIDQISTP
jgi:Tol biopolymer transport system component